MRSAFSCGLTDKGKCITATEDPNVTKLITLRPFGLWFGLVCTAQHSLLDRFVYLVWIFFLAFTFLLCSCWRMKCICGQVGGLAKTQNVYYKKKNTVCSVQCSVWAYNVSVTAPPALTLTLLCYSVKSHLIIKRNY